MVVIGCAVLVCTFGTRDSWRSGEAIRADDAFVCEHDRGAHRAGGVDIADSGDRGICVAVWDWDTGDALEPDDSVFGIIRCIFADVHICVFERAVHSQRGDAGTLGPATGQELSLRR